MPVYSSRRIRRRRLNLHSRASQIRPGEWQCRCSTPTPSGRRLLCRTEGFPRRQRRQVQTCRRKTRSSHRPRRAGRRSDRPVVCMRWQHVSAGFSNSIPTCTIRRASKTSGYANSASTKTFLDIRRKHLSDSMSGRTGRSGNGWRRRSGYLRRPR